MTTYIVIGGSGRPHDIDAYLYSYARRIGWAGTDRAFVSLVECETDAWHAQYLADRFASGLYFAEVFTDVTVAQTSYRARCELVCAEVGA